MSQPQPNSADDGAAAAPPLDGNDDGAAVAETPLYDDDDFDDGPPLLLGHRPAHLLDTLHPPSRLVEDPDKAGRIAALATALLAAARDGVPAPDAAFTILHLVAAPRYVEVDLSGRCDPEQGCCSHARLTNVRRVAHVPCNTLAYCGRLRCLNLSPLCDTGIRTVGDGFLSGCASLTSVNLRPLAGVVSVGDDFLSGCSTLRQLQLGPLSNVTRVGLRFLESTALRSLNLRPLANVGDVVGGATLRDVRTLQRLWLARRGVFGDRKTLHMSALAGARVMAYADEPPEEE